ncbi:MarR family winged helix-turn-helix transcriptional regulator [Pendulispora albinea]|uniref:MarR family transcriptional regulator n=1 Tax=Pendulispora albinea TaxID=2741071 RepID=A0ABZ2LQZ5_9BACT
MVEVKDSPQVQTSSVLLAEEISRLILRTRKRLWHMMAATLEERGESSFDWPVLCYLARNGPSSQRDLAYGVAQHPAGLSRLIEELEGRKLVRRRVDKNDRRRQLVEATAKGKAWVDDLTPHVFAAFDQALGGLEDDERHVLRSLLIKLLAAPTPE